MSLILNALDAPLADRAHVHCLSDGSQPLTLAELGANSRRAAAWLEGLAGRAGTVAALMTGSHDCLATFFGALCSGMTLVSLPHPARGMDADEYLTQIGRMCALGGATQLLCDPELAPLLSAAPVAVHPFSEWDGSAFSGTTEAPGRFVQFTSGSTGTPRGVVLSLDAIDANLTSMYGWLEPQGNGVVCSWLPLSHDMGLIGLTLYAICSVNPPWSVPTDLVLMNPEAFMTDPGSWMRACTDYRATSTTSPPFALRLASRALRSPGSFDLSSLRSFVVGSEPVPADTLREFEAVAREFGLSPHALSPGYGMAEATLAVAIDPMTSPWSSARVDPDALAAGEWQEVTEGGTELVSCGPPVWGTEVRTSGGAAVGELEIRSGSLLDGYVGDGASPLTADGWLHTADLAHVRDGNVFIAGRTDDVFIVAGRNIDARALDALVGAHPACRPGNAACVPDGLGRYVVVAEPRTAAMEPAELRAGAREIRVSLARRFAASPSAVVFIERGTLPKTPSGKVRRNHLRSLWARGNLHEVAQG
jgi:acyl-CoA synthetase (AMP-forming)/AMP-acid ligase II